MNVDQTTFHTALLDPKEPVPEGLSNGQGKPAGNRFGVYRNNVAASLTEALEISFPVIAKIIGAQNFKAVAGAFLRQHPPKVPMLAQYGDEFPGFLEGFKPLANLGYLPDVARLEQALRVSYHAADAAPIEPAALQALTPEELASAELRLAPSARLTESVWPIHGIWRFNSEEAAPKPQARGESVLVLRAEFDPEPHLLTDGAAACVRALLAGANLSDANDKGVDADPNFDLGGLLGLLLSAQAITDIITGGS